MIKHITNNCRSSDNPAPVDFDPDSWFEKILSMLDMHSDDSNLGPGASNLQDSTCYLDDSDLESLSDGSFGDEGEEEEIRELMDLMDQQLAGTAVGRSFERENKVSVETGMSVCNEL